MEKHHICNEKLLIMKKQQLIFSKGKFMKQIDTSEEKVLKRQSMIRASANKHQTFEMMASREDSTPDPLMIQKNNITTNHNSMSPSPNQMVNTLEKMETTFA